MKDIMQGKFDMSIFEDFLKKLPGRALHLGIRVLFVILTVVIGVQLIKILRKIIKKSMKKAKAEVGVIQFVDSFVKTFLYIILFFVVAENFGIDATSIVALLGSAGVAIGLALQGSLSNFAGGVLILLLKPFKVGDYIIEDNKNNEGTVQEIQLFYTKLATPDNKIIVLPNGSLANTSLTNVSTCKVRRIDIKVGISYDADVKQAKEVLTDILKKDEDTIKDRELLVYVDELADSSVNLGVRCWVLNENYWNVKWRITEKIKYALDENSIDIPFPQLDLHCKKEE